MLKKTTCIVMLTTLLGYCAMAQESGVFLKGGLNIANVSTTNGGRVNDANSLASFQIGFLADLGVTKYFAIQPSLLFTGKGAKVQSGQPGDANYYRSTTNPYYIELPVNFVFKIPMGDPHSSFFFGAGPYIAMGITGKNKVDGTAGGVNFNSSSDIKWSDDDPTTFNEQEGAGFNVMRRFDYGFNGTAGFQLNKLLLSVNYGYGLAKLQSTDNSSNDKNKNRVLSIAVGFKL